MTSNHREMWRQRNQQGRPFYWFVSKGKYTETWINEKDVLADRSASYSLHGAPPTILLYYNLSTKSETLSV